MPARIKNLFLLIFCLMVLPLVSVGQCPPITSNVISSSDGVLCASNAKPSLISGSGPAGGTGNYTYQWQQSTDNVNFTVTNGTLQNYDPPVITTITYYRRVVSTTNSTCTVPSVSNVITISTLAGPPVLNNTIVQPAPDPDFCTTSAIPSIITGSVATGAGTLSYSWQKSTDNSFFSDIIGALGQDYTPTSITATTYYRRMVGSNVCVVPSISNVITVLVTPPVANTISTPAEVLNWCGPAHPAFITGSSPPGDGYNFQWQISTDNINFIDVPSATTKSYDPPLINVTTSYRRKITVSACAIATISNSITVVIHPTSPISNNSIAQPAPDPVFCTNNADPSVINGTVPIAAEAYTYQWQSSIDNINFSNITVNGNQINYDPPVITATTYYRRLVTTTICSPPLYSNVITITLTPVILANDITAPAVVIFCGTGDAGVITGNSVSGNGFSYQWQSSADGVTFADIAGAISNTYDPPIASATIYYRRIIISGSCNAPSVSSAVKITVNTTPGATVSGPVTICSGNSTTLTASGSTTYVWSPAEGLSATNIASPVATPLTTTTYIVTMANGGCGVPLSVTVTVVPKPKVSAGSDKGILNGDKVQLDGQIPDSTNVQYSWSPTTYLSDPYT